METEMGSVSLAHFQTKKLNELKLTHFHFPLLIINLEKERKEEAKKIKSMTN